MRGDAGVLERLFRQARELVPAHLRARGTVALAGDTDLALARLALPGQHLDQLALAVARDAGDADDLAGRDGRARHRAAPAGRHRRAHSNGRCRAAARRHRPVRAGDLVSSWAPIIIPAIASGVRSQTRPTPGETAAPQHGDLVGERHHLAKLVGNHQHGEVAAPHHLAQHAQDFVGLAGVSTEVGSSRMRKRRCR